MTKVTMTIGLVAGQPMGSNSTAARGVTDTLPRRATLLATDSSISPFKIMEGARATLSSTKSSIRKLKNQNVDRLALANSKAVGFVTDLATVAPKPTTRFIRSMTCGRAIGSVALQTMRTDNSNTARKLTDTRTGRVTPLATSTFTWPCKTMDGARATTSTGFLDM